MTIKSRRKTAMLISETASGDPVPKVPPHILSAAMRAFDILEAAVTLEDARLAARGLRLAKLPEKPTRFGAHLGDKFWITFYWDGRDAHQVDIEYRK